MQKLMVPVGALLCFIAFAGFSQPQALVFGQTQVEVGDQQLQVEYADTFERRARGLMYRKSLCAQCGMLFRFDTTRMASMWMKNTYIPLDVAFITADGVITDIRAMQPHDLNSVGSSKPVLFALEMNQGWFAEHGIRVGQRITIGSPENSAD